MADLPAAERPQVSVLNTLGPEFRALADRVRALKGADFSICDVEAPVRVTSVGITSPQAGAKTPSGRTARRSEANPPT
jgi:hypothetical protein